MFFCTSASVLQGSHCTDNEEAITSHVGVISSAVADSTGCGSMRSPWSVKMAAGQRLSVTLTDYGWGSAATQEHQRCVAYAYITEKATGANQTICGGSERRRQIYTSTTNHVLIQIVPQENGRAQFLLHFTGIAN